jgi:5-methylcytosine-specific restriction protein A
MIDLVPGRVYKRRELHLHFSGQRYGGISTPKKHPVILLFTGEQGADYGYYDGFRDDGSFWYSGEGQVGDMHMVKGNLAIQDHKITGKTLHLFEDIHTGVQYIGEASYIRHRKKVAPDRNGDPRQAIVFELAIASSAVGAPGVKPDKTPAEPSSLWKKSLSALRDEALASAGKQVPANKQKRTVYYRSAVLKVYVLRRANGFCEGCGAASPFCTPRGKPYLEPHHVRRRADGGPDHPRWVIALCPNCHARVHHGADGAEYNAKLGMRLGTIEED